jgi:hypothetical protein
MTEVFSSRSTDGECFIAASSGQGQRPTTEDHDPDLGYRDVSPPLQQMRGHYPITAGIAAYNNHVQRHHRRQAGHLSQSPATGTSA